MVSALLGFSTSAQRWFQNAFQGPTPAQEKGWASILSGASTLLLAPTGSGKTLAAFLVAIDRLMFSPAPDPKAKTRVLYISPLKALGVDVERNLRAPLAGIRAVAERDGVPHRALEIGVRSGDTPANERAKLLRHPPDILITTPESLYLLLTSSAAQTLANVETVIVDEIHAMVTSKRGVHLALSLERLESLQKSKLQRIGLSATQRPLDEVARLLGGGVVDAHGWRPRPVNIVDAGKKRSLDLQVVVPVEDMARLNDDEEILSGDASQGPGVKSIWPAIHPRLLELIQSHRTTLIFVNSRRLAERLAGALNELAEEELVLSHHGSLAKDARLVVEDKLKRGELRALVATSSLELGIDMGAVDLVIQVEAPPSIASGLQRVGRAGHQVGATSAGVLFPKFRGDLLPMAAAVARMYEGLVEETFYPRNPLDVLAQQIVAMVAQGPIATETLYDRVRGAAPFSELPRASFEGVLDMLSGRYPSEQFADLKPRVTWDRLSGVIHGRQGVGRIAIINGGTIPDRGLYGVFLATESGAAKRVGELDEEMVFESRVGDVFILGASSWRIEDITPDRVVVSPAPGEPGRMPFWKGDRVGRPPEFGRAIGELGRKLLGMKRDQADQLLQQRHAFDPWAAKNLLDYLHEQDEAAAVPTDRTLVLERFLDEVGDWRVCLLSPFGGRVHAPWCTAVAAVLSETYPGDVDYLWSDEGFVFRLPGLDQPPPQHLFFPDPDELDSLVVQRLANTALFAAHFRENAGRSLLLPKRDPRKRTPLWATRRRAADLLNTAARFPDFPIVLETFRECLKDVFDLPGLTQLLNDVRGRKLKVEVVDSRRPSPFSASMLFGYVANFLYEGDTPLAERRAQALTLDHAQLKALLGEAELRSLFDEALLFETEQRLQRLEHKLVHPDQLHDLLLALGELSLAEIQARTDLEATSLIDQLLLERRVLALTLANERRYAASEDAGRYRDALGVVPPPGLPAAFLAPAPDALSFLLGRWARTHGPFTSERVATRFGFGTAQVTLILDAATAAGRLIEGAFLPGGRGREWCDADVLRGLKQRALARLRRQVEPVDGTTFARFLPEWHGLSRPRPGLETLMSALEQLQGAPLPASVLEAEILPARVQNYLPGQLDELCAAGEIVWRGLEPLGSDDGRVALYLTDHYARLAPPIIPALGDLADKLRQLFQHKGALFFADLVRLTGAFHQDLVDALWSMVWAGELTNDTLAPLRSFLAGDNPKARAQALRSRGFRSRRIAPPGTEGRWSLLPNPLEAGLSETERRMALVQQLLTRHGVLTKEAVPAEGLSGGFAQIYPVLKAAEDAGKLRRGYFIAGLGGTQFALPGADDRLRQHKEPDEDAPAQILAATDPANPYGAALPWPEKAGTRPMRAAGALVVLYRGYLLAYLGRSEKSLTTFLPEHEPERGAASMALARALAASVERGKRRALLVSQIDGVEPHKSFLAPYLGQAGFSASSRGFLRRRLQ